MKRGPPRSNGWRHQQVKPPSSHTARNPSGYQWQPLQAPGLCGSITRNPLLFWPTASRGTYWAGSCGCPGAAGSNLVDQMSCVTYSPPTGGGPQVQAPRAHPGHTLPEQQLHRHTGWARVKAPPPTAASGSGLRACNQGGREKEGEQGGEGVRTFRYRANTQRNCKYRHTHR
jgi:hypothetical protein